jgi:hypothetical protein
MSDVSVERLAGMVRTEIDQAAAAKDAWAVCEADLMAMYGASHTTVELALCRLTVPPRPSDRCSNRGDPWYWHCPCLAGGRCRGATKNWVTPDGP